MKSVILTALLSTVAVAEVPRDWVDFRFSGATPYTYKPVLSTTAKPGAAPSTAAGTGPYKATHFGDLGFVGHTIFAPVNPPKDRKMPVLIYSNNGGLAIGLIDAMTVGEIASYGYYVVVEGAPDAGFSGGPGGGPAFSKATDGFDAVNWVVDQAAQGKLPNVDTSKIYCGGTSMGGMQSYTTLQETRVKGAIIISSGLFGGPNRAKLSKLTKPIGFFEGGAGDMATNNGKQDIAVLTGPRSWANGNFGHGMVNANRAAGIVAWLDWQAHGNATAGKFFTDPSNGYLKSRGYTEVYAKGFPA